MVESSLKRPENFSKSFIGKQAEDLGNLIREQIKPVYEMVGIIVPVKSCSIIHSLKKLTNASLADLAKSLNQSHQLIKQKLPKLKSLGLIDDTDDPNDKRRTLYFLTDKGKQQAKLLEQNSMSEVYQNLSKEVNANIYEVLTQTINSLKQKNLYTRFIENKK